MPSAPPSDASVAHLAMLRPGTPLWMRDPRRTPVRLISVRADIASFTVEVRAFEDSGARWTFPLWQAEKFLCAPTSPQLPQAQINELEAACTRLNQPLHIPIDTARRAATEIRLQRLTAEASDWLSASGHLADSTATPENFSAFTNPKALSNWLRHHNVLSLEQDIATRYVSNPHAGETIKAHRLALAELGLCPYDGRILRDTEELSGDKALPHRMRHILARLAYLRAAFTHLGTSQVLLYRTIYSDSPLTAPRNTGFVSATFSLAVAQRFLKDGATKAHSALLSQHVPVTRLFMTHLETPQMRAPHTEAEALLLFDPNASPF
ncbi:hypothetical protein J7399_01920 [Shimia sp. R9_1]|uniref:hypothetical protein n=1 Tax=Shimia sp. R9_1 TaxID=2821111 RepID=UPI001ADAA5E2|nr:hypothetical protein [Shimia sp. R9_1]MBO9406170.1 hypothetical protein [Shimia sp. R9_1]